MKDPNYYQNLCKNFTLLRRRRGCSIKEISKATRISAWELLYLDIGTNPEGVSCLAVINLCNYFNVTIDEIFSPLKIKDACK